MNCTELKDVCLFSEQKASVCLLFRKPESLKIHFLDYLDNDHSKTHLGCLSQNPRNITNFQTLKFLCNLKK